MSRKSDIAKLERIAALIADTYEIIGKHGTAEMTLSDKEGQYALLMCISQIGELLSKIETESIADRLPVKEANAMRNVIVHNYEGVNFRIVTRTLQDDFPRLKAAVLSILAADPSSSQ
jgi:uncharacterized protein with HEPN domain